jgi:hypothetical protein
VLSVLAIGIVDLICLLDICVNTIVKRGDDVWREEARKSMNRRDFIKGSMLAAVGANCATLLSIPALPSSAPIEH